MSLEGNSATPTGDHSSIIIQPAPLQLADEGEMVRQLLLHHRLHQEIGGILPEQEHIALSHVECVLDVACGAGSWLLDAAAAYPYIQFIGIDSNEETIRYASDLAWSDGLRNAAFIVQDIHQLNMQHTYPHGAFDLINMSFLTQYILTLDYPALLSTLFQLCHTPGILRWLEPELPITNSKTFEHLLDLLCRALQAAGSPFPSLLDEQRTLGITARMKGWLREIGCSAVHHFSYAIDVSFHKPAHHCFQRNALVLAQRLKPLFLRTGVITSKAFEEMTYELQAENFTGICSLLVVVGKT